MNQIEQLKKRWENTVRFRALHAAMSLEKEGLTLGAGTVLSKRNFDGALALDGDECMAAMVIALAGLPKLADPADSARRLFIADCLMKEGVSPRDIWTALDFDPAPLDELDKRYNPDQPRVPAGSGRTSGEWTSGNAACRRENPNGRRRTRCGRSDPTGCSASYRDRSRSECSAMVAAAAPVGCQSRRAVGFRQCSPVFDARRRRTP